MPTFAESVLRKATRPIAGARRAAEPLLGEEDLRKIGERGRKRTLLENIFHYLDLPGATVRNLLTGEFGGALESAGAFLLPGLVEAPEEQPDFGFVGNLLTDPLLFLTGGGAGAKAAFKAASTGLIKRGLKRGVATRFGAKALSKSTTKAGRDYIQDLAKGLVGRTPGRAKQAAELKLAREAIRNPKTLEKMIAEGLLDKGGVKFGIPFMEGRTIARAGKATNLAQASPYYWVAKSVGKKIGRFAETSNSATAKLARNIISSVRDLGDKLYLGRRFSAPGKLLAATRSATLRRLTGDASEEILDIFKGFDEDALKDFTQTLAKQDVRGTGVIDAATFQAKHPDLPYDEALRRYQGLMDRIKDDLVERGIWEPRPAGSDPYFPHQYSDEMIDDIERVNWMREMENTEGLYRAERGTQPRGVAIRNKFMKKRKYQDLDEYVEHLEDIAAQTGLDPKKGMELDIAKLTMNRMTAHARTVANHEMMKGARRYFGTDIGIIDRAFSGWLKSGAGQLEPRGAVMGAIDFVNRKFFKPFVTVGIGPIANPAFHIRNMGSGIWQALAHPEIGLSSGLRHAVQIINDGLEKATRRIPGMGKTIFKPSQLTRILKGENLTDDIVRVGGRELPYTEKQLAQLLREKGVTRTSFVRSEEMIGELQPIVSLAKTKGKDIPKRFWTWLTSTKFPGRVAEAIEDRMRAQGFAHALAKGLDPDEAARAVREAFIDYDIVSEFHRGLRDVVPFAQFSIGQAPRTIRTVLERPRALAPLTHGLPESTELVPSWVGEQPHFPVGRDVEGKRAYVAGLGTPFEDINKLWAGSLGRTLERGVAMTTPPIKTLYEAASGREPFFGSAEPYRRETPVTSAIPDLLAGRRARTIKTKEGPKDITEVSPRLHKVLKLLPISRQLSMVNQLFDTRKSTWQKAVSLLTGAKVVSVDEERELKKLIKDYLTDKAEAGDIGTFQKFFAYGDVDPELASIIKAYYAAKRGK